MPRTGKPIGRPAKPAEEKYVRKMLSFPPDLWAELEARVPEGERATFVQGAVARELGVPGPAADQAEE